MTTASNILDYAGIEQRAKRCGFWSGGCKYAHREAYNGDRVWACVKCGHIHSVMSCRDYEWEIYKACLAYPEAAAAYINWVPKDPGIKAIWDRYIGYDSSKNHNF